MLWWIKGKWGCGQKFLQNTHPTIDYYSRNTPSNSPNQYSSCWPCTKESARWFQWSHNPMLSVQSPDGNTTLYLSSPGGVHGCCAYLVGCRQLQQPAGHNRPLCISTWECSCMMYSEKLLVFSQYNSRHLGSWSYDSYVSTEVFQAVFAHATLLLGRELMINFKKLSSVSECCRSRTHTLKIEQKHVFPR